MWDANGTIAIDHFYDDIHPFSKQQLERVNLSFDQSSYERDFGVRAFCNEKDRSIKESNWLRPSLEINGLWGGYTGPGFKTVIPAKLSGSPIFCSVWGEEVLPPPGVMTPQPRSMQ